MRKCFVDLETTGLEPWNDDPEDLKHKGVVLSAGFILDSGEELEVIIMPTLEEWGYASPKALEYNGMDWDFLKENGMERKHAIKEIFDWLYDNQVRKEKDYVFFAQNSKFDKKFLLHLMADWLIFMGAPDEWIDMIPIFKLIGKALGLNTYYQNSHHISKELGVPEEPKPHQAIEGARAVKRNFEALKKKAKEKKVPFPY
jgi:DNA polymerase III epsilon subunit-like protein